MTKTTQHWLATLTVAAVVLGSSLVAISEDSGPTKAETTPTPVPAEKAAPARSSGKRETYPFRGRVAAFDTANLTLKLEGKANPRLVQLTLQTRLTKQGQPAQVEDLKTGEEVGGTLRKTPEGREEAVLIRIGPKTPPEAAAAPKPTAQVTQEPPPAE